MKGFCIELFDACRILKVEMNDVLKKNDVRKYMKRKILKLQEHDLLNKAMICSKMDNVLLSGFSFDGTTKKYLVQLDFVHSKVIFMSRFRMWPTKRNFPGRWSGILCNICGGEDTDEHIFSCPGYFDILVDKNIHYKMLFDDKVLDDMLQLRHIAEVLTQVVQRIEEIQSVGLPAKLNE